MTGSDDMVGLGAGLLEGRLTFLTVVQAVLEEDVKEVAWEYSVQRLLEILSRVSSA